MAILGRIFGERLTQSAPGLARRHDDKPRREIQWSRPSPFTREPSDSLGQQRCSPRQKMTADVDGGRHHGGKVHHARRVEPEVQTRSEREGSIFNQDRDRRSVNAAAGDKKPRGRKARGV